ncbi:MAG: TrkH family potassium uptake protein [Bacteroidales bacterium]|jgi:trk system potassium uptake protein TrkH|nr:TrkH family potassium uptake protein [Bacteroidales bacterium]
MIIAKTFNYKILFYILGLTISFIGFCFIPSIVIAYLFNEQTLIDFVASSILAIGFGFGIMYANRKYPQSLTKKEGRAVVGLIWSVAPIVASIPFLLLPQYFSSPINALFESFSGFTTTGSSILTDLENIPKSVLLWRALTQWIGGLGLTLIIIIFMKNFRNGANYLFNAEFTSIDKEKIHPHINQTVSRIFIIYFGYTILAFTLLYFGDMDIFTAVCHSLSTISTGGFTTVNGNIGQFSAYTQYVIMGLMFISGISYVLIYWLFKGKIEKLFKDEQTRFYTLIILLGTIVLFVSLFLFHKHSLAISLKSSFFHIISIVSTTGYYLPEAQDYGLFAVVFIIILMFIGGSSSSSSTGLKIIRVIILFKYLKQTFRQMFHPRAVLPIRYNKIALVPEATGLVFGFFFLYLMIFILGAFILTLFGNEFLPSIALSASNLSNIGPVVGYLSPETTYDTLNSGTKTTLIVLMLIGRLEIFSFLAMFSKSIWMKD